MWHWTAFVILKMKCFISILSFSSLHISFAIKAKKKIDYYFHTGCTYISLKVLKDHTALYRTKCNKTEFSSKFQIWSFKNTFHFYSYGRTLTIYRNIESHLSKGVEYLIYIFLEKKWDWFCLLVWIIIFYRDILNKAY